MINKKVTAHFTDSLARYSNNDSNRSDLGKKLCKRRSSRLAKVAGQSVGSLAGWDGADDSDDPDFSADAREVSGPKSSDTTEKGLNDSPIKGCASQQGDTILKCTVRRVCMQKRELALAADTCGSFTPLCRPIHINRIKNRTELLWFSNLAKGFRCACEAIFCNDSVLKKHRETCTASIESLQVLARKALDTKPGQEMAVELVHSHATSAHTCYRCGFNMNHTDSRAHEKLCKHYKVGSCSFSVHNKFYCLCGECFVAHRSLRIHQ